MDLVPLGDVKNIIGDISDTIQSNPVISAAVGLGAVAVTAGTIAAVSSSKKKKTTKSKSKSRKSSYTRRKSKKKNYKYARTAGKGKDRSTRRIRMTKNGQPYVILKSGKARFIKKSSARLSRKRKGGRY